MKIKLIALALIGLSSTLQAQSAFDTWVGQLIEDTLNKQQVGENGKGTARQKESPSADPRSTSLVDQSSATDFVSVAANVIPVTPGVSQFTTSASTGTTPTDSSAAGSTTATASLYALLAALNKTSPTDPNFYAQHVSSRRISLTIGTAASKQATDNTTTPATVYGAKILLINGRELYTQKNLNTIRAVQKAVSDAAKASSSLKAKIKLLMFSGLHPEAVNADGSPASDQLASFILNKFSDASFPATLNALSSDTKKKIQALIESSIDTFASERQTLQNSYDKISKGTQMSIAYTADIRDAKGNNEHQAEFIFDYGINPRINWTVNATGDYRDRKATADSKGGHFATSFQGDLTKSDSAWGRDPIRLVFSGEGEWLTAQKPQYTFEAKLSIPLASGIDLPVVYRYANRIAQINQTDSEARLGLSVDISRLAQAFK